MKAVVFDFSVPRSIPRYLVASALGKWFPSLCYGRLSVLKLRDIPEPSLPGPRWIKVKPVLSGVCGTDIGTIFFKTSTVLEPFNSFPAVLGHEVVGVVTEVGRDVRSVQKGQRVAVDPYFSCEIRGISPPCRACREGLYCLCRHSSGSAGLGPGMLLGFNRDLPGAWSETIVIHETMAVPLPDGVSDHVGVLLEPLSVGLHAVLRQPPSDGEHVLIIGGGMIAYSVIVALRLMNIECRITHFSLLPHQRDFALKLGADRAFTSREELIAHVMSLPETSRHKPMIGPPVYLGGFDAVYDCIGSKRSLDDSLRFARDRGKVTIVGLAGVMRKLDWSFIWMKELSVMGAVGYGREFWKGRPVSTFHLLLELMAGRDDLPLAQLVTHEFSLDQYREAIQANVDRAKYRSVKTVFRI